MKFIMIFDFTLVTPLFPLFGVCVGAVGVFFGCLVWRVISKSDELRYVIFYRFAIGGV